MSNLLGGEIQRSPARTAETPQGQAPGKQARSEHGAAGPASAQAATSAAGADAGGDQRIDSWDMTPGMLSALGISSADDRSTISSPDEQSTSEAISTQIPMAPGAAPGPAGGAKKESAAPQGEGQGQQRIVAEQIDEQIIDDRDSVAPTIAYSGSIARGGITLGASEFGLTSSAPSLKNIVITQASGVFTVNATYELITKWDTRRGTGPNSQVNIADENSASLTASNYPTAVSDLTPNLSDEGGRPPRTRFWAQDLTERHEQVHARDHQTTGREGLRRALTWLTAQTASTQADVEAHLATFRGKIVQYILANGAGSVGELHAYGDGAPLYKARADAIKAKGDGGGYP